MAANDIFTTQKIEGIPYSTFDLSHEKPLSCKMGYLYPILSRETMPGDIWKIRQEIFGRLMPMVVPPMTKLKIYTNTFFVPFRIMWKPWQGWIFETKKDRDEVFPTYEMVSPYEYLEVGKLPDHLGIAPQIVAPEGAGYPSSDPKYRAIDNTDLSAMFPCAYQKIWYEYFRDANLIDVDGDDPEYDYIRTDDYLPSGIIPNLGAHPNPKDGLLTLRKRAWKKDYFTSALPWAQKGDSVQIPLGFSDVPLAWNGAQGEPHGVSTWGKMPPPTTPVNGPINLEATGLGYAYALDADGNALFNTYVDGIAQTSLMQAVDGTVENLRTAFQVQRWLELNAVGGSRYVESLQKFFGTAPRDETVNRPVYIGGTIQNFSLSEVLQTSETTYDEEGNPTGVLADMAGHGITSSNGKYLSYRCKEHGIFMTLVSVMSEALYFQGVDKQFFKKNRFDFAFPSFAHLGEQEILKKELLMNGSAAEILNSTFGYTPRYAEYKFINSLVAGQFRSTLSFWHYGRFIQPALGVVELNQEFIEYSNDKRIFAVTDHNQDEIILHINSFIFASRPLPKYGTPISLF